MTRKRNYDPTKLTPGQREAAVLLVEYQFTPKAERELKSLEEIAEKVGVTRMTLHRWRKNDENFIALVNELGETYMTSKQNEVYNALLKGAVEGNTKSIELFLKNRGLLTDRVEIEETTGDRELSDRTADLERRMRALQGKSDDDAETDDN